MVLSFSSLLVWHYTPFTFDSTSGISALPCLEYYDVFSIIPDCIMRAICNCSAVESGCMHALKGPRLHLSITPWPGQPHCSITAWLIAILYLQIFTALHVIF